MADQPKPCSLYCPFLRGCLKCPWKGGGKPSRLKEVATTGERVKKPTESSNIKETNDD